MTLPCLLLLSGCAAPPKAVELESSFWQRPGAKIAIVMAPIPESRLYVEGNMGILDIVIAQGVSSELEKQLRTLDLKLVSGLPARFQKMLADKSFDARIGANDFSPDGFPRLSLGEDFASRDYTALGNALQADALLVIEVQGLGTARNYYGFIPNSPPAGYFMVTGQLIELKTSKLLWQRQVRIIKSTRSEWDQPPDYPYVTQKVYEAIDAGTSLLIADFSWHLK